MADKMGLAKSFSSVAAINICKLLTEKVEMGLPLISLWGNSILHWVNMTWNNFPGNRGEEQESYLLERYNAMSHCLLTIQKTPPQGHSCQEKHILLCVIYHRLYGLP